MITKLGINPKEMRIFIDDKTKMKKPADRIIVVRSIARPAQISNLLKLNKIYRIKLIRAFLFLMIMFK